MREVNPPRNGRASAVSGSSLRLDGTGAERSSSAVGATRSKTVPRETRGKKLQERRNDRVRNKTCQADRQGSPGRCCTVLLCPCPAHRYARIPSYVRTDSGAEEPRFDSRAKVRLETFLALEGPAKGAPRRRKICEVKIAAGAVRLGGRGVAVTTNEADPSSTSCSTYVREYSASVPSTRPR